MKKVMLTMVALLLVLGLAACAAPAAESPVASSEPAQQEAPASAAAEQLEDGGGAGQPLTIAATFMDMSNPYFATLAKGFTDECDARGYKALVHDGAGDAASQVTAVENFLVQGCDALVLGPVDQNSMGGIVEKAKEKNIPILGVNQPVEGCDAFFLSDEYNYGWKAGTLCAEWVNQKLGGEAQVALIVDPSMEAMIDRSKGCEDAVRELAPGAEIVSIQGGSLDGAQAATNAESILQAYPDVKAIVTINDVAGLAVMEVVNTHGLNTEDFFVCGLDATDEALAAMQDPDSVFRGTVSIKPYDCGKQIVQMCEDLVDNGSLDPSTVYFDMEFVTQEGFDVPDGTSVADYIAKNG